MDDPKPLNTKMGFGRSRSEHLDEQIDDALAQNISETLLAFAHDNERALDSNVRVHASSAAAIAQLLHNYRSSDALPLLNIEIRSRLADFSRELLASGLFHSSSLVRTIAGLAMRTRVSRTLQSLSELRRKAFIGEIPDGSPTSAWILRSTLADGKVCEDVYLTQPEASFALDLVLSENPAAELEDDVQNGRWPWMNSPKNSFQLIVRDSKLVFAEIIEVPDLYLYLREADWARFF